MKLRKKQDLLISNHFIVIPTQPPILENGSNMRMCAKCAFSWELSVKRILLS